MAAEETALATAVITVGISCAVGYGLYKVISVKGVASTASDYGRKWLAWIVFLGTIAKLPSFFQNFDADSFAQWILIIVFYGVVAFVAGWIYGKYFGKKQQTNIDSAQGTEKMDPPINIKKDKANANNNEKSWDTTEILINKKINKQENSSIESEFYKIAWDEIENNKTKQALWSKSFADSDGDENKTKAKYINLRVRELKIEKESIKIKSKPKPEQQDISKRILEEKIKIKTENFLKQGLTQEDIDYLGHDIIRASEYLRKKMVPQKNLDKLIGEGKIKGSLVNGVLWIQYKF